MGGSPPIGLGQAKFGVLRGHDSLREALPGRPSPVLPAPCPLWLLSLPQKLCNKFSLSLVSAAVLDMGRSQTWTPALDVQPEAGNGVWPLPTRLLPGCRVPVCDVSWLEESVCRVSSSSKAIFWSTVGEVKIPVTVIAGLSPPRSQGQSLL